MKNITTSFRETISNSKEEIKSCKVKMRHFKKEIKYNYDQYQTLSNKISEFGQA